ncbi:SRPBCC family protein [Roseicyclus sp.]|uniref:SRPBCC family protein n=1 Tax=Roseicyclus sp. TaxID=1914329 RepID=UPI003FA16A9C
MRRLGRILIGLAVVVLIAAGAAYLLPRHVVVERQIVIDAPPEEVYRQVSSLRAFSEWSPWGDYDPDMEVVYSGPDTGVGNVMEWRSDHPNVGNGRQEIVAAVENRSVRTTLIFDGMNPAEAWWTLEPEGEGTRVTWGLDSDMGNTPVGRWFGLALDRFVGADYERGLDRLRARVEG